MASKEKICSKCGKVHICENHHILPFKLFKDKETDFLCPNCHREFHRKLGYKYLQKENKQPMEFYLEKYYRWLAGLSIIAIVLIIIRTSLF